MVYKYIPNMSLWDKKPKPIKKKKTKSNCKTKLKACNKLVKELRKNQKPVSRGGLPAWRKHLQNYRNKHPNVPFRQAQKNASVIWKSGQTL